MAAGQPRAVAAGNREPPLVLSADDVVVIGGGVSGLAAATVLARAGVPVVLLEARGVLGGRATSFRDPRTGEVFDNGQHALMGCYDATFAWLETIGSRDRVTVQSRLTLPIVAEDGRRVTFRCPEWPSPWHLVAGVIGWRDLSLAERLRVGAMVPALLRARRAVRRGDRERAGTASAAALPCTPDETVADWLDRHGQRGRVVRWLWEPLALAATNQDIAVARAAPFVRVLGRIARGRRADGAIALARCPLAEVFAGPARAFLDGHGARVRLHALARVSLEAGRVTAVTVRGTVHRVSTVIVATPWHTWPSVLTGEVAPVGAMLEQARRTAASPIVTVYLEFDRPVINAPIVGLPGRPMQWAFDVAGLEGHAAGTRVAMVSSGAEAIVRLDDDALVTAAREALEQVDASVERARIRRSRVVREPRATFSLAPGQPPRPATRTGVEGLYLAGDWVDTGLPATIEGAVEAGCLAAAAVLEDRRVRAASVC